MAFKPVRLSDKTSVVSLYDSAIDQDKSDFEAFRKVAAQSPDKWREFVFAKEGETLTEFHIGVIPPGEFCRITDSYGITSGKVQTEQLCWSCFLYGLRGIDNWFEEVPTREVDGVTYVKPDYIKKTFVKNLRQVAVNVGMYIHLWNQITEDEVKN
jgi:hypothetical protein